MGDRLPVSAAKETPPPPPPADSQTPHGRSRNAAAAPPPPPRVVAAAASVSPGRGSPLTSQSRDPSDGEGGGAERVAGRPARRGGAGRGNRRAEARRGEGLRQAGADRMVAANTAPVFSLTQ